ncbi:hypothetical protein [Pararobbsia alpina]|nr:hypothetical protein [Pararobbsia alpina]
MAEKYVPNADLILLVGRADDLSFLNLDALTLPRIQDWRIIPQRFRIVTTYSFTPDSQRKQVDARDGPLTADGFRRRLRQQIETFGRPLPEDEVPSNLLFPLEFGDSWTSQAARQDGFYERINPIVAELKQQLHRDIEESATEIGRIRSAVQVHVIADNVKKARLVQLDAALSCERERLEALEDEQARVARRLEMAEKALAGLAHLSKLEAEVPAGIERDCQTLAESAKACGAKLRGEIETNRNSFIDKISTYSSALLSVSMDYRPELIFGDKDNFWTNISPAEEPNRDELRDVIQREFETTRKKLSGYFLEEYYPNVSRDFAIDKALLDWDMTAAANAARKWLAAHWKTRAAERLERKKKEQKLAKSRATLARGDLDEVTRRCAAQQDLLAGKEQERQAFSDRMDRERETGGDFRAYLDEAYLLALRARMREGREAAAPSESLLMLLSAAQLGEERKNILIGQ